MHRSFLALTFIAAIGCQSSPDVGTGGAKEPGSQASEMPASLRCRQAADCRPESTCYWGTPACVAVASAEPEKCGDDADPADAAHPPVTCDCFEGQCTPRVAK